MPNYKEDADALEQGDGDLWMVRVTSSADETDYVDLQVRAPTMEDAAVKAETHARQHPDMYFDLRLPTFGANRHDIYRVDEDGEEMTAPMERSVHIDNPRAKLSGWAILDAAGQIVKRGFDHQYQADAAIADRVTAWEEAHGLREPDDSEERYAGSDAPFPGTEA